MMIIVIPFTQQMIRWAYWGQRIAHQSAAWLETGAEVPNYGILNFNPEQRTALPLGGDVSAEVSISWKSEDIAALLQTASNELFATTAEQAANRGAGIAHLGKAQYLNEEGKLFPAEVYGFVLDDPASVNVMWPSGSDATRFISFFSRVPGATVQKSSGREWAVPFLFVNPTFKEKAEAKEKDPLEGGEKKKKRDPSFEEVVNRGVSRARHNAGRKHRRLSAWARRNAGIVESTTSVLPDIEEAAIDSAEKKAKEPTKADKLQKLSFGSLLAPEIEARRTRTGRELMGAPIKFQYRVALIPDRSFFGDSAEMRGLPIMRQEALQQAELRFLALMERRFAADAHRLAAEAQNQRVTPARRAEAAAQAEAAQAEAGRYSYYAKRVEKATLGERIDASTKYSAADSPVVFRFGTLADVAESNKDLIGPDTYLWVQDGDQVFRPTKMIEKRFGKEIEYDGVDMKEVARWARAAVETRDHGLPAHLVTAQAFGWYMLSPENEGDKTSEFRMVSREGIYAGTPEAAELGKPMLSWVKTFGGLPQVRAAYVQEPEAFNSKLFEPFACVGALIVPKTRALLAINDRESYADKAIRTGHDLGNGFTLVFYELRHTERAQVANITRLVLEGNQEEAAASAEQAPRSYSVASVHKSDAMRLLRVLLHVDIRWTPNGPAFVPLEGVANVWSEENVELSPLYKRLGQLHEEKAAEKEKKAAARSARKGQADKPAKAEKKEVPLYIDVVARYIGSSRGKQYEDAAAHAVAARSTGASAGRVTRQGGKSTTATYTVAASAPMPSGIVPGTLRLLRDLESVGAEDKTENAASRLFKAAAEKAASTSRTYAVAGTPVTLREEKLNSFYRAFLYYDIPLPAAGDTAGLRNALELLRQRILAEAPYSSTQGLLPQQAVDPRFAGDMPEVAAFRKDYLARFNRGRPRKGRRERLARTNGLASYNPLTADDERQIKMALSPSSSDREQALPTLPAIFESMKPPPGQFRLSDVREVMPVRGRVDTYTTDAALGRLREHDLIGRAYILEPDEAAEKALEDDDIVNKRNAGYLARAAVPTLTDLTRSVKMQGEQRQSPRVGQASTLTMKPYKVGRLATYRLPREYDAITRRNDILILASPEETAPRVMTFRGGVHLDLDVVPRGDRTTLGLILGLAIQSAALWAAQKDRRLRDTRILVGRIGTGIVKAIGLPNDVNALTWDEVQKSMESGPSLRVFQDPKKDREAYLAALASATDFMKRGSTKRTATRAAAPAEEPIEADIEEENIGTGPFGGPGVATEPLPPSPDEPAASAPKAKTRTPRSKKASAPPPPPREEDDNSDRGDEDEGGGLKEEVEW
jgi:hypothetical protein